MLAHRHALAVLLLAAFAAIAVASAPHESPTVDEHFHFTRGAAIAWTGDTRLSHGHPPLANAIGVVPVAGPPFFDFPAHREEWRRAHYGRLAPLLIKADYERFRDRLFASRDVMIALATAFGAYFYWYCSRRFGKATGLVACFLYATHPILLAHGRLLTTDMPVAAAVFVALAEFDLYLERRGPLRLITMGLAIGVACATKFNAILLVPIVAMVALVFATLGIGRFAGLPFLRRIGLFAAHALAVTALTVLVVDAAYGFQKTGLTVAQISALPEPKSAVADQFSGHVLDHVMLGRLPSRLIVPLPYTYLVGLGRTKAFGEKPRASFFMGELGHGSYAYFPTLLVLKQPLAVVLLLGLGLFATVRRWFKRRAFFPKNAKARATCLFVFGATVFVAVTASSLVNIGVRHVMPAVPLLVALAARAGGAILEHRATRPWRFRAVSIVAWASTMGLLASYPHYIPYFNALVPTEAARRFVNGVGEDWGQDMADLATLVRREHLRPFVYGTYGYTDWQELNRAGVSGEAAACSEPPERASWVALHVAIVSRSKCFGWLGLPKRAPDKTVNGDILLYHYVPTHAVPHKRHPVVPEPMDTEE